MKYQLVVNQTYRYYDWAGAITIKVISQVDEIIYEVKFVDTKNATGNYSNYPEGFTMRFRGDVGTYTKIVNNATIYDELIALLKHE